MAKARPGCLQTPVPGAIVLRGFVSRLAAYSICSLLPHLRTPAAQGPAHLSEAHSVWDQGSGEAGQEPSTAQCGSQVEGHTWPGRYTGEASYLLTMRKAGFFTAVLFSCYNLPTLPHSQHELRTYF